MANLIQRIEDERSLKGKIEGLSEIRKQLPGYNEWKKEQIANKKKAAAEKKEEADNNVKS